MYLFSFNNTIMIIGDTEPIVCPKGYYCSTPFTKEKCPVGYFCITGASVPKKCPSLRYASLLIARI